MAFAQRSVSVKYEPKKERFDRHNQLPLSTQTPGDWIKTKRIEKKLSPSHLAAKMGIAQTLIRIWENGTKQPDRQQMATLERIFGGVISNLFS